MNGTPLFECMYAWDDEWGVAGVDAGFRVGTSIFGIFYLGMGLQSGDSISK